MKLQIIVGSTRPGRVSDRLARWVANEANKIEAIEAEVVDLVEYPLPFLDEPISPQYNPERKPNPQAKKWLDKLSEAEAYVIVTPEYNRSISGVLKNALDYLDFQFAKKPVAIVAHGSSGGAQAVANLRMILPGLKAISTPVAVFYTGRVGEDIDEQGNLKEQSGRAMQSLEAALDEIKWYSDALAAGRAKDA